MKMTVYIDLLILVNILVNYFLIKLTAVLSNSNINSKRIIISSFIGSLFSLIIIFDMPVIVSVLLKVFSVVFCSFISFGFISKFIFVKRTIILLSVYMMFTGILQMLSEKTSYIYINNCSFYISINPIIFVAVVVVFYMVFTFAEIVFCQHPQNFVYNIVINTEFGNIPATGFYDTGFKIKDIMHQRPVIMCSMDYLGTTGLYDIYSKTERFYNGDIDKEIIPLFYSDITGGGMLPAFKTNSVIIKKNKNANEVKNVLVAVSKKDFSNERQIIFGKDFYDRFGD
ncbi:MAG: hypothetical protein E7492_00120 [Ruminococcaceae bacterium]|nr:hypothetical protein [Oscillospiraceae bacterium]